MGPASPVGPCAPLVHLDATLCEIWQLLAVGARSAVRDYLILHPGSKMNFPGVFPKVFSLRRFIIALKSRTVWTDEEY